MVLFSAIFCCFFPSPQSSQVSDDPRSKEEKAPSMVKDKRNSKSSKEAAIVASYFPINSILSRF
ncbi:hypothetical protein ACSBR2_017387 [Camellia fascicularis]